MQYPWSWLNILVQVIIYHHNIEELRETKGWTLTSQHLLTCGHKSWTQTLLKGNQHQDQAAPSSEAQPSKPWSFPRNLEFGPEICRSHWSWTIQLQHARKPSYPSPCSWPDVKLVANDSETPARNNSVQNKSRENEPDQTTSLQMKWN